LGLRGHRRQVRIPHRQLRFKAGKRLSDLCLLALEGIQSLLLPSLLLLDLGEAISQRAWIFRVGWHCGDNEQQRRNGGCWADYSGGAPAEPGMPGSRLGVRPVVPPNGAGAPFGFFSFFFFFSSRRPLSRDFAMVLPP
jgi:hypothetical protein